MYINIAEEQNLPHYHIRLQNKMSMESNVNKIAGTHHGAVQAMHDSQNCDHFTHIWY